MIRINAVAREGDLEPREAFVPRTSVGCRDGLPRPKKQSPVQAAGGDCVSSLKAPAGKDRLHDLEAVRDPLHAAKSGDMRCQDNRSPTQPRFVLRQRIAQYDALPGMTARTLPRG
jgi:hypothetical protein